jgi:hypothetical protein
MLLSLLVVSPQLMVAVFTAQTQAATPALISVENTTCLKTLSGFNETVTIQQYVTSETWTNGTRLDISERILNCTVGVCVNCTTWLDPNATSTVASLPAAAEAEPSAYPSGYYSIAYNNKYSDYLWFLGKGSNGTCTVSYDHDDNYDNRGYYPRNWTYPFDLQGQTLTHIHLPVQFLDNWYNGELSTAAVIGLCMLGYKAVDDVAGTGWISDPTTTVLEAAVSTGVGFVFGVEAEVAAAILMTLADILYSIIKAIYQHVATALWIDNVVREGWSVARDGWAWRSPLDQEYWCEVWDPYFWTPMTVYNWHRIFFYNQTWGSQGAFGTPTLYAIDLGLDHQTCSPLGPAGVRWQ